MFFASGVRELFCCRSSVPDCTLHLRWRRLYSNQYADLDVGTYLVWFNSSSPQRSSLAWLTTVPGPEVDEAACKVLQSLFTLPPASDAWLPHLIKKRAWQPSAANGTDSTRFYPNRSQLLADLYELGGSMPPYDGVQPFADDERTRVENAYASSAQRSASMLREVVIKQLGGAPRTILEVGSFIGSGAVHAWAPLARLYRGPDAPGIVICADTWQGALMMKFASHKNIISYKQGFPDIAETFRRRIATEGMKNVIYPLALPSLLAARVLYLLGYQLDVIYVDSAHEVGETLVELHLFYLLLRPNGLLMGDDISWPAVSHDVDLFAKCHGLSVIRFGHNQWYVKKPA